MKKLLYIFGTRPELIKMAPLYQATSDDFHTHMLCTGQHTDLIEMEKDCLLKWFDIDISDSLQVMTKNQTPSQVISKILEAIDTAMSTMQPDMIIVQGDTATTFAGAMAGFLRRIPVVHIEAGLRTDDIYSPFPEEMFRRLTTRIGALHFAPTQRAYNALISEGISPDTLYLTGNTGIDSLKYTHERLSQNPHEIDIYIGSALHSIVDEMQALGQKIIYLTMHRRENAQAGAFADIARHVLQLTQRHPDITVIFPVHPNPHVRDIVYPILDGQPRIYLIDPVTYIESVYILSQASLVMTDSGGLQEESAALGIPTMILRENTERPEAVENGNAILAGNNGAKIYQIADELLSNPEKLNALKKAGDVFGDGQACQKINQYIKEYFAKILS